MYTLVHHLFDCEYVIYSPTYHQAAVFPYNGMAGRQQAKEQAAARLAELNAAHTAIISTPIVAQHGRKRINISRL